jgi:cell division protein FtsL
MINKHENVCVHQPNPVKCNSLGPEKKQILVKENESKVYYLKLIIALLSVILVVLTFEHFKLKRRLYSIEKDLSYRNINVNSVFSRLDALQNEIAQIQSFQKVSEKNVKQEKQQNVVDFQAFKWAGKDSLVLSDSSEYGVTVTSEKPFRGNWEVKLKILNLRENLYIGISNKKVNGSLGIGFFANKTDSFVLNLGNGYLYSHLERKHYTQHKFQETDIITLSMNNNELSFLVNDKSCGVAFSGIRMNEAYLSAFVRSKDAIELISYVQMPVK